MKRLLLALGLLIVAVMGSATIASANGGPHGDYTSGGLTDKCAGCHRVHQALSNGMLLKATSAYALCLTCHNGAGSQLDVLDGIKLNAWATAQPAGQPFGLNTLPLNDGGTLNGGGFEYIRGVTTTSRHNEDASGTLLTPWGYAGIAATANYAAGGPGTWNTGSNAATGMALQCTSCHNPHGSPNYRLLKNKLNGQTVGASAWFTGTLSNGTPSGASNTFVRDEGARGLEAGAPANKYTKEYYGSAGNNSNNTNGSFSNFCGGCHTAYPSDGATLGLDAKIASSDPTTTTHYRHKTEMPITTWVSKASTEYSFPVVNPEEPGFNGATLRLASGGTTLNETNTIVTCLTCHRVHGTTATMQGWAVRDGLTGSDGLNGSSVEEITQSQTAASPSTLLYLNNRGICETCHQWPN